MTNWRSLASRSSLGQIGEGNGKPPAGFAKIVGAVEQLDKLRVGAGTNRGRQDTLWRPCCADRAEPARAPLAGLVLACAASLPVSGPSNPDVP